MSFLASLSTQRVLVIGGGVTGAALIKFLSAKGAKHISVLDEKVTEHEGVQSLTSLEKCSLAENFDLILVSPGWKKDHPDIVRALTSNVSVMSELDFAWKVKCEIAPDQIWVGLTGTNGKTTTIQMVECALAAAGRRGIACGNVGITAVEALMAAEPYEILALELSSFQIEWSATPQYETVAILNIADDHIDWHGSFENYAQAKLSLLERTKVGVLNLSDPEITLRATAWQGKKVFFGLDTPQSGEIGLVENLIVDRAYSPSNNQAEVIAELADINPAVPHNVLNAMAAAAIALSIGISHADVRAGLARFSPDHHRLEKVLESDGVEWVDDSKATNPHAALAALGSFLSVVWIAGGLAKGARMDSLIQRAGARVRAAILIGEDRDLIAQSLREHAPSVEIHFVDKVNSAQELMDDVVKKAKELANPGDTVLLAPACASMDQFTSYAQRGDFFVNSVRRIVK